MEPIDADLDALIDIMAHATAIRDALGPVLVRYQQRERARQGMRDIRAARKSDAPPADDRKRA
jgi:hypothetical protein